MNDYRPSRVQKPAYSPAAIGFYFSGACAYTEFMRFERVTIDPAVATGKPCIRGLRFPVSRLLGLLASGESRESILRAYPYLESADIDEALRYAAWLAEDETVEFAK